MSTKRKGSRYPNHTVISLNPVIMSVIAVAGGTGKLGRAIVDALISEGKHTTLVLAREVCGQYQGQLPLIIELVADSNCDLLQASESKEKELGARIVAVNYGDIDGVSAALESNKVDIVISTIDMVHGSESEHALVQSAAKSSTTKRYIPSTWGIEYSDE